MVLKGRKTTSLHTFMYYRLQYIHAKCKLSRWEKFQNGYRTAAGYDRALLYSKSEAATRVSC